MAKLFTIAILFGLLGKPEVGVGAYYHESPGLMKEVCERRMREGWHPPGIRLSCDWPCLAANPRYEPESIGEYWFVDLPGLGLRI